MNDLQDYLANRLIQSKNALAMNHNSVHNSNNLVKWRFLDSYAHKQPLSRMSKMDFIRACLDSYVISDTTIDILVRTFIRMTLPEKMGVELLSLPEPNGRLSKVYHSETTPGMSYTTTESGCDCPGFRGNKHCKHHDNFLEVLAIQQEELRSAQEIIEEWDREAHFCAEVEA